MFCTSLLYQIVHVDVISAVRGLYPNTFVWFPSLYFLSLENMLSLKRNMICPVYFRWAASQRDKYLIYFETYADNMDRYILRLNFWFSIKARRKTRTYQKNRCLKIMETNELFILRKDFIKRLWKYLMLLKLPVEQCTSE